MSDTKPKRTLRPCPICKTLSDPTYHPFCSKRCADIDLGKWLGGDYAIPVVEDDASMRDPASEDY